MTSPIKGKFRVTQTQHSEHDGLDMVALDDVNIYSTVNGYIVKVGWENILNHKQGFGYYVVVKQINTEIYYFYGHLEKNSCALKQGDYVSKGTKIGVMGNTGRSTGAHLHYCCRKYRSKDHVLDISKISCIPNKIGTYDFSTSGTAFLRKGSWNVRKSPDFSNNVVRIVKGPQTVIYVDIVEGDGIQWYQLRDGNYISVNACEQT